MENDEVKFANERALRHLSEQKELMDYADTLEKRWDALRAFIESRPERKQVNFFHHEQRCVVGGMQNAWSMVLTEMERLENLEETP